MKKSFFILSLMATSALAANAWADCTPVNNGDCGTNCTYSINADCHLVVQGPTEEGTSGRIKDQAFYANYDVTSAEIKGNITSIGSYAFMYAGNLTSVVMPDSVTEIGNQAFRYAESLTSVTIPNSVTSIGISAFGEDPSLTSVVIPDSVTSIGNFAFYRSGLTSITISDSVTEIGNQAFQFAFNLTSIVIPDSVTSIGSGAFIDVPSTAEIFCPDQACRNRVKNASYSGNNFVDYIKGNDGVYTSGGIMYASAEDMRARQNACTSEAQCREKVQEYKEAKATQMAQNGVLCQTKQGCLNLMDMVSNDAYECTTIATCSAAVKNGSITGVNLAAADPVGGGTGGAGSSTGGGKRIYTVEEARQAVEAAGTDTVNFRIRYK